MDNQEGSDPHDFTILVPACGNRRVRVRKDPIRSNVYLVEPAIWHPAVSFIGQKMIVSENESPQLLLSDIERNMSSPGNIEAAVQYRKNIQSFDERNANIVKISSGEIDCCICLETFKDQPEIVRFMCLNMHWVCRTCYNGNEIKSCPLCRFNDPYVKMYRFGVVQCHVCEVNTAMFNIHKTDIEVCSTKCANLAWNKLNNKK